MTFLTAQNDDPELLEWLANAQQRGGDFVKHLAEAGLRADAGNYPLLRPVLMAMRAKYTDYEPTAQVKGELRQHKTCPACFHIHEGDRECAIYLGGGRYCDCKLEVPA